MSNVIDLNSSQITVFDIIDMQKTIGHRQGNEFVAVCGGRTLAAVDLATLWSQQQKDELAAALVNLPDLEFKWNRHIPDGTLYFLPKAAYREEDPRTPELAREEAIEKLHAYRQWIYDQTQDAHRITNINTDLKRPLAP